MRQIGNLKKIFAAHQNDNGLLYDVNDITVWYQIIINLQHIILKILC